MPVTFKNEIKISREGIAAFFNDESGPLMRKLLVVADEIKAETIRTLKGGFPRDFLGPGIVKRVVKTSDGPHVIVGSDRVRTKPHTITGNPVLAFNWKRIGRFVIVRSVNHPGSDFGPYLLARLDAAALVVGRAKI